MELLTKATLWALLVSQVVGNPMMFYSQPDPDCSQQSDGNQPDTNSQNYQTPYQAPSYPAAAYQAPSYQAPSYQAPNYQGAAYQAPSYQGDSYPSANNQGSSYQETLQAMITETLRALCSIVQSTVMASKQEIAELVKVFTQKASGSNCNSEVEGNDHASLHSLGEVSNSIAESGMTQSGVTHSTSNSPLLDERFGMTDNNSTTPSRDVETTSMKNNSLTNVATPPAYTNTTVLPSGSSDEGTPSSLKIGTSTNVTTTTSP